MSINATSAKALSYVGSVRPSTRKIAEEVLAACENSGHQIKVVWGFNPASRPEHSAGTALDFMCTRAAGDFISDYLWNNRGRLGLRWMIWRQRIRSTSLGKPSTWQAMANRGSTTANHYDHVHVNFAVKAYSPPTTSSNISYPTTPSPKAKLVNKVSISHLKRARMDDPTKIGSPLGPYADEVFTLETALAKTMWLKWEFVDGHYGSSTVGDGSWGFGGVTGFQKKHSPGRSPDGWMGELELTELFKYAGMSVLVVG